MFSIGIFQRFLDSFDDVSGGGVASAIAVLSSRVRDQISLPQRAS
jgi:hypothetical protein